MRKVQDLGGVREVGSFMEIFMVFIVPHESTGNYTMLQ